MITQIKTAANLRNLLFLICAISLSLTSQAYAQDNSFQMGGYYKNLFITTQSSTTKEGIASDLQRLRLEFKEHIDPWQFYLTLDNEAVLNDFANTSDFDIVRSKSQNNLAAWDLDKVSVDDDHLYLKHSIYRAYAKYHSPQFQAVVGKQAIDWGRMRFYSPLDIFNPTGPIDLEPEERVGTDAINLNFSPENFVGINAVAAPGENSGETSFGLKLYKTISPYDLAFIAASVRKDTVVGFSFDGSLSQAGFRGEVTHTEQDNKKSFTRLSVGMDYNFNDKLYALWEQFFNDGHEDNNPGTFTSSYRLARQILSLKKNLTSILFKYSLTPLLELSTATIYDWDAKSIVVNPQFKYNVSSNVDIVVGSQMFFGNTNSEFGPYEHLYYVEFKWFF